nr:MAG TPA: hypothetical protein [Caudoviricetes sp.]
MYLKPYQSKNKERYLHINPVLYIHQANGRLD